jgi:hypothetical protein
VRKLIAAAAAVSQHTPEELLTSRVSSVLVFRRALYSLALKAGNSAAATGRATAKDHSTVLTGVRRHRELLSLGNREAADAEVKILAMLGVSSRPSMFHELLPAETQPKTKQKSVRFRTSYQEAVIGRREQANFALAMMCAHPELIVDVLRLRDDE